MLHDQNALISDYLRRFTFARIDISYARFFFYESAEKALSYARLNCAVFNYFYMSLGQVRHTVVVSRDRSCCLSTFFIAFTVDVALSVLKGPLHFLFVHRHDISPHFRTPSILYIKSS